MNRTQLTDAVASSLQVSKAQAANCINAVLGAEIRRLPSQTSGGSSSKALLQDSTSTLRTKRKSW